MPDRVSSPPVPQLDDTTVSRLTMWGKFFLTVVAALGVTGAVAVTQLDLQTGADVEEQIAPLEADVKSLKDWREQQRIINRCLVWDVDPETCERALGESLPRPGGED